MPPRKENFAVIDTETTWDDRVMSIGVIIAEDGSFAPIAEYYGLISPECTQPAMYSYALHFRVNANNEGSQQEILSEVKALLEKYEVKYIFAYNSSFDERHLPELSEYCWTDIMQTTAYRQYNPFVPAEIKVLSTGRMRTGYDVGSMLRLMGAPRYNETHNALCDCRDELFIMAKLRKPIAWFVQNHNKTPEARTAEYKEAQELILSKASVNDKNGRTAG